jgi:hypothetical protein
MVLRIICIGVTLWLGLTVMPAIAHEIRPAVVTAGVDKNGAVDVLVSLNLEAVMAGIGPDHKDSNDAPEAATYNGLRALPSDLLERQFGRFAERWLNGVSVEVDGAKINLGVNGVTIPQVGDGSAARISVVRLAGVAGADAKALRWTYSRDFGSSILRVKLRESDAVTEAGWLKDGQQSEAVSLIEGAAKSRLSQFIEYVSVGFTHIVPKGLDHILFVLGLYLLSTHWKPLLTQVTAFTVAHSITLALGLYGAVAVSPAIVEPLIALSIAYVAIENLLTSKLQPWRPFVVFGFGLLHGLGFAGILQEIGLPRADYVTGLLGFNVGVELGQLAVIAGAWILTGVWFSGKPWYRERIVWPASAAIALAGVFWTVERIWFA